MYTVETTKDGKEIKAGKIISNVLAGKILGVLVLLIIAGAFVSAGFIFLGLAGITTVLLLNSIVIIPTVYFGVPTRFKERKREDGETKILEEGINSVTPLVDDLLQENLFSKKLVTAEVKAKALSKDRLGIDLDGSVQYKPSDLDIYIGMSPKTITEGMIDAVESELGKICGMKSADTFIKYRTEAETLIQCTLQLERPPHYYLDEEKDFNDIEAKAKELKEGVVIHLEKDDEVKKSKKLEIVAGKIMGMILKGNPEKIIKDMGNAGFEKEKIKEMVDKLSPENWTLKEEEEEDEKTGIMVKTGEVDIVSFYKDNASRIATLLDYEETMGKRSRVEKLYGINVKTFRLAKLSFSPEAQKAFEKSRSAAAEMEAAGKRFKKKIEMLEKYIKAGISPAAAVNLVETTADVKGVERQIISVEGTQSADLLAFAKLMAGSKGG